MRIVNHDALIAGFRLTALYYIDSVANGHTRVQMYVTGYDENLPLRWQTPGIVSGDEVIDVTDALESYPAIRPFGSSEGWAHALPQKGVLHERKFHLASQLLAGCGFRI